MTVYNSIVSDMNERPKRLREAKSREGMRALVVWLPERTHHALARLRLTERLSISEVVREAVADWLKRRRGKKP